MFLEGRRVDFSWSLGLELAYCHFPPCSINQSKSPYQAQNEGTVGSKDVSLEFMEADWASQRNQGIISVQIISNAKRLDEISKTVSVIEKRFKVWISWNWKFIWSRWGGRTQNWDWRLAAKKVRWNPRECYVLETKWRKCRKCDWLCQILHIRQHRGCRWH